jgi:glutaredoxin
VQNWNAGKTQEYKDRREYDLTHSHLTHTGPKETVQAAPETKTEKKAEAVMADTGARAILFATPTCPNCRIATSYLDKAGFEYEKLYAEENADLALSYGVKQAPTLVVRDGQDYKKYAGAGAIKQFLSQQ